MTTEKLSERLRMMYFVSPDVCNFWGQVCDKCENKACLSRQSPSCAKGGDEK
jgi:hypothetical protein